MAFISDSIWDLYRSIINDVHDDFNQDVITLLKKVRQTNRYQEDNSADANYSPIELKCLVQYNIFRTWPMTKETDSGAIDKESIAVFFNNNYLSSIGMLTNEENLDFDPGNDLFSLNGQKYGPSGETPVAQAKDVQLFTILILKRLPNNTTEPKY